jgi:hypothetical protein
MALNSHSWVRNKTFEFRLHHGTTNPNVMRAWASLCSRFVDWAATRATVKEIEALSHLNPLDPVGCDAARTNIFDTIVRGDKAMMRYATTGKV